MSGAKKAVEKQSKKSSGGFFRSLKTEMKKVTWPTKKELINYEIVVVSFSLLTALAIWVFDMSFTEIIGKLIEL